MLPNDYTDQEKRLISRGRKTWYKRLRRGWHTLSVLVVVFAVLFMTVVRIQKNKQQAYDNKVTAIQVVAHADDSLDFQIKVDHYANAQVVPKSEEARMSADQTDMLEQKAVSLGLTPDKRLGYRSEVVAVPCGIPGKLCCAGQLIVYSTYCGCPKDTVDETVLRIDSTGHSVSIVSSRKVPIKEISPTIHAH